MFKFWLLYNKVCFYIVYLLHKRKINQIVFTEEFFL